MKTEQKRYIKQERGKIGGLESEQARYIEENKNETKQIWKSNEAHIAIHYYRSWKPINSTKPIAKEQPWSCCVPKRSIISAGSVIKHGLENVGLGPLVPTFNWLSSDKPGEPVPRPPPTWSWCSAQYWNKSIGSEGLSPFCTGPTHG